MLPPPSHNYSVDQFKWTHFDVDEGTELFPMVSLLSAGSSCMGSFSLPELAYIEHPVSLTERRMVFSADHRCVVAPRGWHCIVFDRVFTTNKLHCI